VDISLQLGTSATGSTCVGTGSSATAASAGSLTWLQGKWSGSSYDQNPSARASFGQYKSPLIYLRESF
jgi:hypothetical protein